MSRKEKISEPPPAIEKIISVVRLLPVNAELRSFYDTYFPKRLNDPDELFSSLWEEYGIEDEDAEYYLLRNSEDDDDEEEKHNDTGASYKRDKHLADDKYKRQALEECLLGLPEEFVAYVRLPEPSLESLHEVFCDGMQRINFSYQEFLSIFDYRLMERLLSQWLFMAIQRYCQAREFNPRLYNLATYIEAHKKDRYGRPYYPEKSKLFEIKDVNIVNGKVQFLSDEFTEAFNGVDADRIKLCGNCKKVFWVKRTDMKGCSVPCAKVLRTRKWREKTTPEQRQNYKINKIKKETQKGAK